MFRVTKELKETKLNEKLCVKQDHSFLPDGILSLLANVGISFKLHQSESSQHNTEDWSGTIDGRVHHLLSWPRRKFFFGRQLSPHNENINVYSY